MASVNDHDEHPYKGKDRRSITVDVGVPNWIWQTAKLGFATVAAVYLLWYVTQTQQQALKQMSDQAEASYSLMHDHVKSAEAEAESAKETRQEMIRLWRIICGNTATDVVRRRACIEQQEVYR